MCTSGIIVGASDVVVQLSLPDDYSVWRTLAIGVGYGSFCFAPVLHTVTMTWSRILPSTSAPALLFKTIVDMTTAFPVNLSFMIALQARIKGNEVIPAVKENIWPSLSAGWKVWPIINIVTYRSVPLRYRVLFLSTNSFFWNAFMIWRFTPPKEM
jgi:hypothetical protein